MQLSVKLNLLIVLLIYFTVFLAESTVGTVKIKTALVCPKDNETWKRNGDLFGCTIPLSYHCYLSCSRILMEACIRPRIVQVNYRCPCFDAEEVLNRNVTMKYKSCESFARGCPTKDVFFTDEMFRFPGCYGEGSLFSWNINITPEVSEKPVQRFSTDRFHSSTIASDDSKSLPHSFGMTVTLNTSWMQNGSTGEDVQTTEQNNAEEKTLDYVLKISGIVAALPFVSAVALFVIKLYSDRYKRCEDEVHIQSSVEGLDVIEDRNEGSLYDEIDDADRNERNETAYPSSSHVLLPVRMSPQLQSVISEYHELKDEAAPRSSDCENV